MYEGQGLGPSVEVIVLHIKRENPQGLQGRKANEKREFVRWTNEKGYSRQID